MSRPAHVRIDFDHKVVICLLHNHCLLPDGVARHLERQHQQHSLTPIERENIVQYIKSHGDQLHQSYSDIQVPTEPCAAIKSLKLETDSLKCNYCGHIVAGQSSIQANMKKHLRSHQVFAPDGLLDSNSSLAFWSQHWRAVISQRFFSRTTAPATHATDLFEVFLPNKAERPCAASLRHASTVESLEQPHNPSPHNTHKPILSAVDRLRAQLARASSRVEEELLEESASVPTAGDRQTNPYLEHTQFQQCVAGLPWSSISQYVAPSTTPELGYLQATVKSMCIAYQHTVSKTSRWARIRVMQESLQHVPVTPLFHYQAFDNRHSSTIVKIVTFFYQVLKGGLAQPRTFSLTTRQLDCWEKIDSHLNGYTSGYPDVALKHERSELTPFELQCHEFWRALLEQTGRTTDFELAVVTPLAFIAVDTAAHKFRPAYNFATDLSAFKKWARFAACQHLAHIADDTDMVARAGILFPDDQRQPTQPNEAAEIIFEQDRKRRVKDGLDTEQASRALNDKFKDWIYQYLTIEYHTPMSWIISTAHYVSRFRYGETLDAFVQWQGDRVCVRGVSTSFDEYRSMCWSLYHEAETLLIQITFTSSIAELPNIDWSSIKCDPSNDTPGYTPFSHRHGPFVKHQSFVQDQMLDAMTTGAHKDLVFELDATARVERYNTLVQRFMDKLFMLVHFTSGQPGRLTEVASIQLYNTVADGLRNLYMFNDHIAIVPRYHKGYNRDKSLKVIYRFLPLQIASLLVWYLTLVRPFYLLINTGTGNKEPELRSNHYYKAKSPFLWTDKQGTQIKSSERFSSGMKRITKRLLGMETGPSIMRHLIIAFGRHLDDKNKSVPLQPLTPEEFEEFVNEVDAESRETQAGHSLRTATAVYALDTHQIFRGQQSDPNAHLKVSSRWHKALGFDSPLPVDRPGRENPVVSLLAKRIEARGHVDPARLLRNAYGEQARFRGKQQHVVDNILRGVTAVAYIAGTGNGKSLAFYLPATCEGYGQTIVVTPLVALRNDIAHKCGDLHLTCSTFAQPDFDETDRVILAMPEHLSSSAFNGLVARRRNLGQLERLVLDEFHYVLLPDHEYRPMLLNIRELTKFALPITLLSATIPVEDQSAAYHLLGLESRVTTFRESTNRKNICYDVQSLSMTKKVTSADLVPYITALQREHGKVLVYASSTVLVEELADALQCPYYHGQMPEHERVAAQRQFQDLERGLMIATIAINAGVDFLNIRFILWLGEPDHPILFIQAAGRGGRDGLACTVRILLGHGLPSFLSKAMPRPRLIMEDIIKRGQAGQGCLRVPVDAYFDGDAKRLCCRRDEVMCSNCAMLTEPSEYIATTPARTPVHKHSSVQQQTPTRASSRPSAGPGQMSTPADPLNNSSWFSQTHSSPAQRLFSPSTPASSATRNRSPAEAAVFSSPVFARSPKVPVWPAIPSRTHHKRMASEEVQPESPSSTPFKAAKFDQALQFQQAQWRKSQMAGARLHKQLHDTAATWTMQCVRCFAAGNAFDHRKDQCTIHTKADVEEFRFGRMDNKLGSPQCWACFMPMDMCDKFCDMDTGAIRPKKVNVACTYPHVILDAWVCLWKYSTSAREMWSEHIQLEKGGELDASDPVDFQRYFSEMIPVPGAKPIGRIAYDVNWLTQRLFEGEVQG